MSQEQLIELPSVKISAWVRDQLLTRQKLEESITGKKVDFSEMVGRILEDKIRGCVHG